MSFSPVRARISSNSERGKEYLRAGTDESRMARKSRAEEPGEHGLGLENAHKTADANGVVMDENRLKEDGARRYVDFLEEIAQKSLAFEKLTTEDRKVLERAHKRLREQFEELVKWFVDPVRETNLPPPGYGYGRLWELMSAAFMIGSKGTVSDSGRAYFTPAIISELQRDKGRKSGEKRRSTRAWTTHAEQLAKQIRLESSNLSQDDVATEIEARWKLDTIRAPGHPTLKRYVGELIKLGKLPPRA
jgi:hypothetical protein